MKQALKDLVFSLKVGHPVRALGSVEEYVLRFKGIFIQVLIGEADNSVGWSDTFPGQSVGVRDLIEVKQLDDYLDEYDLYCRANYEEPSLDGLKSYFEYTRLTEDGDAISGNDSHS